MWGSGLSRPAATYNAYRAFFLLLRSAPYQSTRLSSPAGRGRNRSGRSRSRAYPRADPDHDKLICHKWRHLSPRAVGSSRSDCPAAG
jgi:hypothetical protein